MKTKVKICGINSVDSVQACLDGSADIIGLNFSPISPRKIDRKMADVLLAKIQEKIDVAFLFFGNQLEEATNLLVSYRPEYVQFITTDPFITESILLEWRHLGFHFLPQVPVTDFVSDLELQANPFLSITSFDQTHKTKEPIILDSFSKDLGGGTGKTFPWEFVKEVTKPFFLAGGLNPTNVAEAIEKVRPYGVDVSSGVESERGVKSPALIQEFLKRAKSV